MVAREMSGCRDGFSVRIRRQPQAVLNHIGAICSAILAGVVVGWAGTSSAQSCVVSGATGAYGTVDVLAGSAVDTTTNFSISCTGTPGQTVRLCVEVSPGQTNAAGNRRLAAGAYRLVHELYSDPSRTAVWGSWGLSTTQYALHPEGVSYDVALDGAGNGDANLTIYGRIFGGQPTSGPGTYVWTATTAPAAEYDYLGAASCPTGTRQATSSGSSWSATVSPNCLVSAGNLSFGTVGVLTSNVDAAGTIGIQCTNGTAYSVGLDAGTGGGATVESRQLTGGGAAVVYSLYRDASRTAVWGTTAGSNTASGTGTGNVQSHTVFGRVSAQLTPAPGTYSDTIVVTVTY